MRRNIQLFTGLTVVALVLTGGASPSTLDSPDADSVSRSMTTPMTVGGFDREIAEDNGFVIREEGGTVVSVPVSTEARAATGDATSSMSLNSFCGTASLVIARNIGGKIRITTGYGVYATSVYHRWNVVGAGDTGTFSEGFSGLNASTTWAATHYYQFQYGTSHGFGEVAMSSYVQLWNGAKCYIYDPPPYDTW